MFGNNPVLEPLNDEDKIYKNWPRALIKATIDPFIYVLQLRDGTVIYFESASAGDETMDWVHLTCPAVREVYDPESYYHSAPGDLPRGMDVRVADIVWAADQGK